MMFGRICHFLSLTASSCFGPKLGLGKLRYVRRRSSSRNVKAGENDSKNRAVD